jgi:hypothetical protein
MVVFTVSLDIALNNGGRNLSGGSKGDVGGDSVGAAE